MSFSWDNFFMFSYLSWLFLLDIILLFISLKIQNIFQVDI